MTEEFKEEAAPRIKFGTTTIDEYQKLGQLGKGTYGEVFKCVHIPTGTIVALKSFYEDVCKHYTFNDSFF